MKFIMDCNLSILLTAFPLFDRSVRSLCDLGRGVIVRLWASISAMSGQQGSSKVRNSKIYILVTTSPAVDVPVNRIVLVHNVDGFAFDGEFDVDGAAAVVGWYQVFAHNAAIIAVFCFSLRLLLVGSSVSVLQAVLADIAHSSSITASLRIVGMTLRVLEPICFFNGRHDRSGSVSIAPLQANTCRLLRYGPLNLESVFAIDFSTQRVLDLNALRIILGLNESV